MKGKRIWAMALTICLMMGILQPLWRGWNFLQVRAADNFVYEEDTWCFSAGSLCDGESPYLTTVLKQELLKGKGTEEKERLSSMLEQEQTDFSYGMAVLALLHKAGVWNAAEISDAADHLGEIAAPKRKDALYAWITYYDMLQYTDSIVHLDEAAIAAASDSDAALSRLEKAAQTAADGDGLAVLRLYENAKSRPKTVLVYGVESGSWTYQSVRYDHRILIANPAQTAFSDDACLYYCTGGTEWCIPEMNMDSGSGGMLGAVIQEPSVLNEYGYAASKLPRFLIERVFVHPGDYDIPITMMQAGLPAVIGVSMNMDLSDAANAVLKASYETNSYDIGTAFPSGLYSFIFNEQDLVYTNVLNLNSYNAAVGASYTPIVSYLVDAADRETVIAAAEAYGLPLQSDEEHGAYYAFPIDFHTEGISSYYVNEFEFTEYPLVMTGEVCIIVSPKETTTTAETKTTTSSAITTTSATQSATTAPQTTITSGSGWLTTEQTTESSSFTASASDSETVTTTTTTTTTTTEATATAATTAATVPTTSKTVETTTRTTTGTTMMKNTFDWGKDNWSAAHDALVPNYIVNGYSLLESHEENLNASLNAMEQARIHQVEERQWLGAEYGMAVTEILAKSGIFPVSMWDSSAGSVYELDLNDERTLSLISYYQLLQENDAVQQQIAWTSSYMTQKSVLTNLITQAAQVAKGGDMVLTGLFSEDASHAVIAYGVEYGSWDLDGSIYDGRILMADPYLDEFSSGACMYFKSSTLEWCVPMWGLSSQNEKCRIGLASNALSLMNDGGYFAGTSQQMNGHPFIPILEVPADDASFILTALGKEECIARESTELNWFSTIASAVTHRRAGLDYLATGYEIVPLCTDTVSYQISYEDCLLSVSADHADTITLLADAEISLVGNNSTFETSMVTESALPWTQISVSGTGCNVFSMQHPNDGILLQGDHLENTAVFAEGSDTTISRRLTALPDGTLYTTAWIYAVDDTTIGVLVDADGDGVCETELQDESPVPEEPLYGDVNLDGMISLKDMILLNRYLARVVSLNEEALHNADCDENNRINSVDTTLILQFLTELIPALPLSKALEQQE